MLQSRTTSTPRWSSFTIRRKTPKEFFNSHSNLYVSLNFITVKVVLALAGDGKVLFFWRTIKFNSLPPNLDSRELFNERKFIHLIFHCFSFYALLLDEYIFITDERIYVLKILKDMRNEIFRIHKNIMSWYFPRFPSFRATAISHNNGYACTIRSTKKNYFPQQRQQSIKILWG